MVHGIEDVKKLSDKHKYYMFESWLMADAIEPDILLWFKCNSINVLGVDMVETKVSD